ncbi:MAG: ABC transporter permease [Gemmatimonadota bacterium]|jgi:predicted permease
MLRGGGSDLRYVLRVLRRSPGFTLVAILSLAMGIGANTAMFGVVKTLLLTPLPVDAPEELSLVTWTREGEFSISQIGSTGYTDPASGIRLRSNFSYPLYRALRGAADPDAGIFAFAFLRGVSVALGDQPAFLAGGALADGRYFSSLQVPMALGRPLGEEDDQSDAPLVAVLSHSFWMRAFGGDPEILGRTVRVNGNPAEVVGITAPGFVGLSLGGFFPQTEITVPLASQPRVYPRMGWSDGGLFATEDVFWLRLMARVPEGTNREILRQRLNRTFRTHPSPLVGGDGYLPEVKLLPGSQGAQPVRSETARLLYFLLGVVGIVLLIVCVNLSSLMLARGISRQREMAVRRSLGGSRGRLVRQLLLEGLVLAGTGTVVGLLLTLGSRRFLSGLLTGSVGSGAFGNVEMDVLLDPAVVGGTAVLGILATLAFSLLPALRLSGLDPNAWLKPRPAGSATPKLTLGRMLISFQIAASVPLVVGAILFLRTLNNLGAVELGFDPRGLATFQVDPGYTDRPEEAYPDLYLEILGKLETIPGVRSVTLMENALMSGIISNSRVTVDGQEHVLYMNAVGPAFQETLGIRLLSGRLPGRQDDRSGPRVGAVNQTAVDRLFDGQSPLGQTLQVGSREVQIVGVINDTPYRDQREPVPPTLYQSALQRQGYGGHNIVLRTAMPIARLEPAIRRAVWEVDPNLPVPEIRTQSAIMAQTSAKERVFTQLLSIFGGFALVLASIGLYGVTSYSVTRRTAEVGIRVAVGAQPRQIVWLILRRVLLLAGLGVLVGIPVALAGGPLVESLLFGVRATDPGTAAEAAVVMLAVATGAGLIPALRAAGVSPRRALETE